MTFNENSRRTIPAILHLCSPRKELDAVSLALDGDDPGMVFHRMLTETSGTIFIDFNNLSNNSCNVVTELPCVNGEDEFRHDITLLVNGMPLAFIEAMKPNNQEGVIAERDRINARFKNKKFKKFINVSQLLVFSNNMEYDPEGMDPIQGASSSAC